MGDLEPAAQSNLPHRAGARIKVDITLLALFGRKMEIITNYHENLYHQVRSSAGQALTINSASFCVRPDSRSV